MLRAAKSVLEQSGWTGFKVAAVLREARLPIRTLYRLFGGKNELELALYRQEVAEFADGLIGRLKAVDDPREKVLLWIGLNVQIRFRPGWGDGFRYFANLATSLVAEFPTEITETRQLFIMPLVEAIDEGVQRGMFAEIESKSHATAIWLMTSSIVRDNSLFRAEEGGEERAIQLVSNSALRMLEL